MKQFLGWLCLFLFSTSYGMRRVKWACLPRTFTRNYSRLKIYTNRMKKLVQRAEENIAEMKRSKSQDDKTLQKYEESTREMRECLNELSQNMYSDRTPKK